MLESVEPLAGVPRLTQLSLAGSHGIADVSPLGACAELARLDLVGLCDVTDVSALRRCEALRQLDELLGHGARRLRVRRQPRQVALQQLAARREQRRSEQQLRRLLAGCLSHHARGGLLVLRLQRRAVWRMGRRLDNLNREVCCKGRLHELVLKGAYVCGKEGRKEGEE